MRKVSAPHYREPAEGVESLESTVPVEVGCRGFPGQSLWRALGTLATHKNLVSSISKQAKQSSRWLWIKGSDQWLNPAGRGEGGQSYVVGS